MDDMYIKSSTDENIHFQSFNINYYSQTNKKQMNNLRRHIILLLSTDRNIDEADIYLMLILNVHLAKNATPKIQLYSSFWQRWMGLVSANYGR